jgi:hypothetical protein
VHWKQLPSTLDDTSTCHLATLNRGLCLAFIRERSNPCGLEPSPLDIEHGFGSDIFMPDTASSNGFDKDIKPENIRTAVICFGSEGTVSRHSRLFQG